MLRMERSSQNGGQGDGQNPPRRMKKNENEVGWEDEEVGVS